MKNFALCFFTINTRKPDSISIIFFLLNFEKIRRHKTMRRWVHVRWQNVWQWSRIAVIKALFSFEQMNKHLSYKKNIGCFAHSSKFKGDFFIKWAYGGIVRSQFVDPDLDGSASNMKVGSGSASICR
jgi:hypothetical protein